MGHWTWNSETKHSGRASHEGDSTNTQWFRRAICHNILDFSRENSPLGVYGGGIRHFMMIRPRVSVDCAGLHRESTRDSNVVVSMFAVI